MRWRGLAGLLMLLSAPVARPEQSVRDQGWVIHYAALNSSALSAATAAELGLRQRASQALVVLSPRPATPPDAAGTRGCARARGVVRRLTGERQELVWRSHRADGHCDLYAEFDIPDGEHLQFDLEVLPQNAVRAVPLHFRQQFYRD